MNENNEKGCACVLRAIASVAEAAQLYFDKNSDTQE